MKIGVSLSPELSKFGPLLFAGNLGKGLQTARDLGYTGVELSLRNSPDIDQEQLITTLKEMKLKVYAIATGQSYIHDNYSLYSAEDEKRQKAIKRIKGHVDFAARLGSMVIIGGIRGKIEDKGQDLAEQRYKGNQALTISTKYAREKSVTLLLEPLNRYETNVINTLEEGLEIIEDIGCDNLRILPDTFHMNIEERSIEESLIRAKNYIEYIHFADSNRLAPGFGHISFERILSTLSEIGYNGVIGIEVLPKPDDFQAAQQAIRHINSLI